MKIINGHQLKQMIISGANNLFNCYPEIDALNVFPVPDGDTGTNMNLTMTSGSKEVKNIDTSNIYEVAKTFSRGLLMGARGNSGVILSQIFRGFAMGLEGKKEANCYDFADALISAKDVAYKAVMKPVEGTILTVIRESSVALKKYVDELEKPITIRECMEYLLEEAVNSLNRTPELLPVLKEVGVVDSGGAGLIKVMEGFVSALNNRVIEREQATIQQNEVETPTISAQSKIENEQKKCVDKIANCPTERDDEHALTHIFRRFREERARTCNTLSRRNLELQLPFFAPNKHMPDTYGNELHVHNLPCNYVPRLMQNNIERKKNQHDYGYE